MFATQFASIALWASALSAAPSPQIPEGVSTWMAPEPYPANSEQVDAAVARLGAVMEQAQALEKQGRYPEAEAYWREALRQRRWLLGEHDPLVAQGLARLAGNLEQQGRYEDAELLRHQATRLLQLASPRKTETRLALADAYSALSYNLTKQGRARDGVAAANAALEELRQAHKKHGLEAAQAYSSLALALNAQGYADAAETAYRECLAIRLKKLGKDDLDTGTAYNNLAVALSGYQRYDEAHMMFVKALDIRRKNGTVPDLVAETEVNTALNLDAQKQFDRAEVLYNRAIATWTSLYGAEDVHTATGYNGLGMNYFRRGRFEEARGQFAHAVRLREAALGHDNPLTAESYGNLGLAEKGLGRDADAQRDLETALTINERTLGLFHPDSKALRELLGLPEPVMVNVPPVSTPR